MSGVRSGEIKALSGLRIVAAVWVVLFHFRPMLAAAAPEFSSALAPILDAGAQGVDLFFILSGFVLTWNYLDRMGQTWSTRATLRFLWLRLARVWPVYLVTMHLAAAWIVFTLYVGRVPAEPEVVQSLNATSWWRQVLLVQLWFEPYFDGTSWDGPAWSISAEWLAYLLFGGLILVVFRIAAVTRARALMWLAVAASMPPILLLLASGLFYTPWSWLPRIVMQFLAGALACAAVRKLQLSERSRRVAGVTSLGIGAAIIGGLYLLDAHPPGNIYDAGGLVDVLFVPFVIAVAIGAGTLPALLSIRPMVYLGHISFSLYMLHEIVHTAWNWAVQQFDITLTPSWSAKMIVVGLIVVAGLGAAWLYHFVEEPARRWMRRMVAPHDPHRTQMAEPPPGRLQPVARAG
ncbi:acyltransferase [Mycobacterium sp. SMC-4]|uniref:acyltransferase family protein n=1 Tax=Mycobacterium sp. SMC-4 TaxID=2857059 RepID=UPI0021B3AE86|nr:acyltransferase [Mycobacterium sp. SMC-4]UXA16032.1 acyltransferase [Mycobacterium sp. SMC-4]